MTRAIPVVASLVAIVAGAAAGVGWISEHLSGDTVATIGYAVIVSAAWLCFAAYRTSLSAERPAAFRYFAYALWLFAGQALVYFIDDDLSDYATGFLATVIALAPAVLELAYRDAKSRMRCPDCREDIRADANVCKHCGFRLRPKPEPSHREPLEVVATD